MTLSNHIQLYQPILATTPESGHKPVNVLTVSDFIQLLREEEDYWPGEQHNTRRMISRLRKIFYDQWGWNSELIRGAADIEGRYQVRIVEKPVTHDIQPGEAKKLKRYRRHEVDTKYRLVTYRANDRVYGDKRVGKVPFIYQHDHQETLLPEGHYCDIAHILAGLDAANHPQIVSPMPAWLSFLSKLGPHVDSNMDIVTWLGDIASSSTDFLLDWLRTAKKPLSLAKEQNYINIDAPGSDMLGDIDAFAVLKSYDVSAEIGQRPTEILSDYFLESENQFRKNRFSLFCEGVGLRGWNGIKFSNESDWLAYYAKQLRDNTSFQAWSLDENGLKSLWIPLRIWLNGFKDQLKTRLLLIIFLNTLKHLLTHEPGIRSTP